MKQAFVIALALGIVLLPHRADAWSSDASKTWQKTRFAAMAVEEYRLDTGKLPSELNAWEAVRKNSAWITPDRPDPFHDDWNRELVYRNPGAHGEFDIYSLGTDGIDDRGGKDDVSNWGGVNEGYHWKESWPRGRFTIIASCVLGLLIFCGRRKIPRHLGNPLAGLVISASTALGCFWLFHPGVVPDRNGPLSLAITASGLLSLVFLMRMLRNLRYFKI